MVRKQFSRMFEKIGAKIAATFLYSSKIRGRNWPPPPSPPRSANKSLPTSGGDAKSLVCQTRVHTHTGPAYWFPFEHVSQSSKQASKHAPRKVVREKPGGWFSSWNINYNYPVSSSIDSPLGKMEEKKRGGIEGLDIGIVGTRAKRYDRRRNRNHEWIGESSPSLVKRAPLTLLRITLLRFTLYALLSR